jgi:hypothetical protein
MPTATMATPRRETTSPRSASTSINEFGLRSLGRPDADAGVRGQAGDRQIQVVA